MNRVMDWRKSSYSVDKGECVEVRLEQHGDTGATGVDVRDTKGLPTVTLGFNGQAWRQFLNTV